MAVRGAFFFGFLARAAGLSLIMTSFSYAGANFSIVPKAGTTPPTEVLSGSSVNVYYTVTNLTHSSRNGYNVVGLPDTVAQSTIDTNVTNLCSNPISLAAQASCSLKLVINGTVNTNFALCKGMNCTTSTPPLNISLNTKKCDSVFGPMTLINGVEETVYNQVIDGCISTTPANYSDVPVRPFIVGNNGTVLWFASNSQGYFKTDGVSVSQGAQDILAHMVRATTSNGQCIVWLTSPDLNGGGDITTYNNNLWMVVPYTLDGQTIYSLVHNEYHPAPPNVANEYGNLAAATSTDAGNTFSLIQNSTQDNIPVFAVPYPYDNKNGSGMTGIGGMFAQSNIIKWGDYYYILIDQDLSIFNTNEPISNGVCIYRTNDITNYRSWLGFDGQQYNVPLVPNYPNPPFVNPNIYLCKPVLPVFYRFSWSYNVVLNKFIIMGIDTNYIKSDGNTIEAFVYTLANLDPITGVLSSATNTGSTFKEYFLREITWLDQWMTSGTAFGQSYPSLLDPTSPQISNNFGPGLIVNDRNFQYSNSLLYVYYTLLFPFNQNHGQDRNVARQALQVQNCIP